MKRKISSSETLDFLDEDQKGVKAGVKFKILGESETEMVYMEITNSHGAVENNADPNCVFRCADITQSAVKFGPKNNVVVHSHGVLEHFDDDQIRSILLHAKNISDYQVHYVPSDKYLVPSRGDERLMSAQEWHSITSILFDKYYIKEFNEGYDLAIVTGMELR